VLLATRTGTEQGQDASLGTVAPSCPGRWLPWPQQVSSNLKAWLCPPPEGGTRPSTLHPTHNTMISGRRALFKSNVGVCVVCVCKLSSWPDSMLQLAAGTWAPQHGVAVRQPQVRTLSLPACEPSCLHPGTVTSDQSSRRTSKDNDP
jgi:hypothetical protein